MSYFEERAVWDKKRSVILSERYIKREVKKAYTEAMQELSVEIKRMYDKIGTDNVVPIHDANRWLSSKEKLKEISALHEEVMALRNEKDALVGSVPPYVIKEMEQPIRALEQRVSDLSKKGYVSHLELLQINIEKNVLRLDNKNQINVYEHLDACYRDGYFRGIFQATKGYGFAFDFTAPDENVIRRCLTTAWSGKNYSKRIHTNTKVLASVLKKTITSGMIQGKSVEQMTKDLMSHYEVSHSRARTLVRTESAYVHEEASLDAYREAGIDKYKYLATLDRKTSPACIELDGKVFLIEEKETGVNYPPMHPNCRSTTVAYFEETTGKRLARGADGKNYEVPADMTYKEWYESLSEDDKGRMHLLNKMDRNIYRDKALYEKYKGILRNEMPSLAKFREMKYNGDKGYESIKGYCKAVRKGEISPLIGLKQYKRTEQEVTQLLGLKTKDGLEVQGYTQHMISRMIGQIAPDDIPKGGIRRGVYLEDVKDAILHGERGKESISKDGKPSILYKGKNCLININPLTHELVQTNQYRGGK